MGWKGCVYVDVVGTEVGRWYAEFPKYCIYRISLRIEGLAGWNLLELHLNFTKQNCQLLSTFGFWVWWKGDATRSSLCSLVRFWLKKNAGVFSVSFVRVWSLNLCRLGSTKMVLSVIWWMTTSNVQIPNTPRKIDMEPEDTPLEEENHLPNHHFHVLC